MLGAVPKCWSRIQCEGTVRSKVPAFAVSLEWPIPCSRGSMDGHGSIDGATLVANLAFEFIEPKESGGKGVARSLTELRPNCRSTPPTSKIAAASNGELGRNRTFRVELTRMLGSGRFFASLSPAAALENILRPGPFPLSTSGALSGTKNQRASKFHRRGRDIGCGGDAPPCVVRRTHGPGPAPPAPAIRSSSRRPGSESALPSNAISRRESGHLGHNGRGVGCPCSLLANIFVLELDIHYEAQ